MSETKQLTAEEVAKKRDRIKTIKGVMAAFMLFFTIVLAVSLPFAFKKEQKYHITLEKYKEIQIDMSYKKVVEIFDGDEGKLLSYTNNTGAYVHEVYQWSNKTESIIIVIQFHNKLVTFKDQVGLK